MHVDSAHHANRTPACRKSLQDSKWVGGSWHCSRISIRMRKYLYAALFALAAFPGFEESTFGATVAQSIPWCH